MCKLFEVFKAKLGSDQNKAKKSNIGNKARLKDQIKKKIPYEYV